MDRAPCTLGFWGVRGSTPTVDRENWRYGGNTACLELVAPDGVRFILDCGTGLRMLGNRWREKHADQPMQAHIFVTHYHWDHIQGIPFFVPFYAEQNRFHFYSFRSERLGPHSLQRVFEAQMASPYFPVDPGVMSARREFSEVAGEDRLRIGSTTVLARWLNHPQGCLGFRFETAAGTIAYATDNEPGHAELDRNLAELAADADIFINDAQYTPEQLASSRRGWGHSSWLEGVKIARAVGAKNLVLFHHDPDSTDALVDDILRRARQEFASVFAAAEGMVMRLGEEEVGVVMRAARTGQRREAFFRAVVHGFTEDGRAFEEKTAVRDLQVQGALLYLAHRPRLQSELQVLMEAPVDDLHPDGRVRLRGYVVRREPGPEAHLTAVGVVFTEEQGGARTGE